VRVHAYLAYGAPATKRGSTLRPFFSDERRRGTDLIPGSERDLSPLPNRFFFLPCRRVVAILLPSSSSTSMTLNSTATHAEIQCMCRFGASFLE